ncbi:MAG: InlB B-repeat-containing protein [Clostridia bacterium]|nr:InlB B-repeat-containing protein [Clostridia bacterium]
MKRKVIISVIVVVVLAVLLIGYFVIDNMLYPKVNVSLDAQGGVLEHTQVTVRYKKEYQIPVPQRDGFSFYCWEYEGEEIPSLGVWKFDKDITLKAVWELRDENGNVFTEIEGGYQLEIVRGTNLDYIHIPFEFNGKPVLKIKENAFEGARKSVEKDSNKIFPIYVPSSLAQIDKSLIYSSKMDVRYYDSFHTEKNINYLEHDGKLAIIGYTGDYNNALIIKGTCKEMPVVKIYDYAFEGIDKGIDSNLRLLPVYISTNIESVDNCLLQCKKADVRRFDALHTTDELILLELNGEIEVIQYLGDYQSNIVVPDKINEMPITSIGKYVFYGAQHKISNDSFISFYRIMLPSTVKYIDENAFGECGGVQVILYRYDSYGAITEISDLKELYEWECNAVIKDGNSDVEEVITFLRPSIGWSIYTYARIFVELDANCEEIKDDYMEFTLKSKYELPTLKRSGYVFLGWYAGDNKIEQSGEKWSISDHLTLVARWEEIK